jgi:hypothetical protein
VPIAARQIINQHCQYLKIIDQPHPLRVAIDGIDASGQNHPER